MSVRPNELATELRRRVRGEVRFDDGSRALYATDSSNYRQTPIGVVIPRSIEDVIEAVAVCRDFDAAILPRGTATSLAGQTCNEAVIIDFTKYLNRVIEIDATNRRARVQPGIVLDHLRNAAERAHGLTFGPDPATHSRCSLGGMIGNNSCGVHSVQTEFYGPGPRTSDNLEELEILTYEGHRMRVGSMSPVDLERAIEKGGPEADLFARLLALRDRYAPLIRERYPKIPRRISGYNLDDLLPERDFNVARALSGTEGTCVVMLEATVTLVPHSNVRRLMVVGFKDVYEAADHVPTVRAHKPISCEGLDDRLLASVMRKGLQPDAMKLLPPGKGWLMVEFGGETAEEADQKACAVLKELERSPGVSGKLVQDAREAKKLVVVRESGLGATAFVPGKADTWEGWEDSAVAPEKLGEYLRAFRKLLDEYKYDGPFYGHFGQGCVHTRINFDLVTAQGIAHYRAFVEDAADLVVSLGGSLSGEHGDGQSRAELEDRMFGAELVGAFREFKTIWDPRGRMNPGKLVDPYKLDENLRLGATYNPWQPKTNFAFPHDGGSFARAALRCVGVGECRKHDHGTMCPSYMVTLEEKHSTRGRARLLFEMLRGETIHREWHESHVKEALDLCLACKGCKHECPVNVDMATYKAEFLSHYYEHKPRPRAAYAMGWIRRWAEIAEHMPGVVNALLQAPVLSNVGRWMAGISPRRTMPRFAARTFRAQHRPQPQSKPGGKRIMLWVDTFNNHFHPQVAVAATTVLGRAGYTVELPKDASLCCGRPLYDYGFLDQAKSLLTRILDSMQDAVREELPIVVLEPSCLAVFRDELVGLFPQDKRAVQLSKQAITLAEALQRAPTPLKAATPLPPVILHAHCHQKALGGTAADESVLASLGFSCEVLDAGCCGMAGSFGFEHDKYEVSQRVGERVLLPRVRASSAETVLLLDGFSCREQVQQATGRVGSHLAELLEKHTIAT